MKVANVILHARITPDVFDVDRVKKRLDNFIKAWFFFFFVFLHRTRFFPFDRLLSRYRARDLQFHDKR